MDSPMDSSSSHLMSTPVASKRMRRDERVNPFEKHLLDRLHQPVWSPSILSNSSEVLMETPPQTTWGIHQMSLLNPSRIEESPSTHQNETILDPQTEANAQAAIKKFFSTTEPIAPSPIMSMSVNSANDKCINTELSFPPILPPDFEQFLYSYNAQNSSKNEDLNSSIKGRKLDFTIDSGTDDEHDLLDFNIDNSTGRILNSPGPGSSRIEQSERSSDNNVFIRSEDFGVEMPSPLSTPIRRCAAEPRKISSSYSYS